MNYAFLKKILQYNTSIYTKLVHDYDISFFYCKHVCLKTLHTNDHEMFET